MAFSIASHYFMAAACGFRSTVVAFLDKYFELNARRREFTNRKNKSNAKMAINDITPLSYLESLGSVTPSVNNLVLNKAMYIAASNKKVKRTYYVKPGKI